MTSNTPQSLLEAALAALRIQEDESSMQQDLASGLPLTADDPRFVHWLGPPAPDETIADRRLAHARLRRSMRYKALELAGIPHRSFEQG